MFHENPLCTVSAMTGEVFEIQQALWQKNQQQQRFLLRYFALPLQEDEKTAVAWCGFVSEFISM